jgi:hypothetical protein
MRTFTAEDKAKITRIINEGIQVSTDISTLKEGLSETVKAVAEELDLKPAVLNKAIRIAHKATLGQERDTLSEVEEVLEAAGRHIG